ncbi:MAG: hypothetical protein JSV67_04060 [Thermoplasmatales archaeon]|nr:MAG: hypothetical protein JSV67_04060 [Thermoplasmatales archaeon]
MSEDILPGIIVIIAAFVIIMFQINFDFIKIIIVLTFFLIVPIVVKIFRGLIYLKKLSNYL